MTFKLIGWRMGHQLAAEFSRRLGVRFEWANFWEELWLG